MAAQRAAHTVAWSLGVLALFAPSATSRGAVEAACLPGAVPPESRASIGGLGGNTSVPFGLWTFGWDSAQLAAHVVKILAEEVLGYNSTISGVGSSSATGLYATAGCRAPGDFATDPQCSGSPAFVHHASLEIWGLGKIRTMRATLAPWPEVIPEDAGDLGYEGSDGAYIFDQQRQAAYQAEGLSLEWYRSYDAAWHRPSIYFDNYSSFEPAKLRPCNETRLVSSSEIEDYLRVSGDQAGVLRTAGGSLVARCWHNSWWLAPSCRGNPEQCVPFLTGADGWNIHSMMQRAAVFNMPVAITVAKTYSLWRSVARERRCLAYWWQPDSSFIGHRPTIVTFPPHDELEHEENILTSMSSKERISKWVHRQLGQRASGLRELVKRTRIPMSAMNKMLLESAKSGGSTYEEVACEWLRKHEDLWSRWIPKSTDCAPGQGLVGSDGSFSRSRASSSACGWCPPGRSSVKLTDNLGTAYICLECEPGHSQPRPRQRKCPACLEGSFADSHGSHECRACSFGEYTDTLGRSSCDACPPGFVTNFRGAASLEACICPEGSYRDEDRRDACLPCKEGMMCPEGSDALGYSPQHAAQHPIVPLLKVGFWSSGEEPLSVFRCKDGLRCPGGSVPGRACAGKFVSQGCTACQAGLVQSRDGCVPCATGFLRILVFPLAPLAATTVVILILYRSSGQPYAQWDSWTNGAGTTVFVVLSHYHVVNIIGALAALSDASSDSTFEAVSVLSDLVSLFKPECGGLRTFMSRLVLESHGPGALLLIFSVVWLVSRALGRWRPTLRMETDRLVDCYVYLILAFFARVVDMAFTVFKCADNPNGLYTLVYDRSVVCYQGRWNGMVVVGASAMLLWCVGFCAVVLHAIRMAPRQFHVAAWRTRWTSLFVSFRPDVHWWFLPIVLKGVLLNSGSLFIHSGVGQIYWVQCILLVYMYLLVVFRPWRHLLNNPADDIAHLSLCLICSTSFWLARDAVGSNPAQTGLMVGLLQANVSVAAVPLIPIVALMWWRDCSRIARDRKDTEAKLIVRQLKLMAECDYLQQLQFLKSLTEHDFELISQTMEVLLMEQGHKMVRSGYSTSQLSKLSRHSVARTTSEDSMRRLFTKTGSGFLGAVRLSITGPREGAHGGLGQHAGSLLPFLISKSGFFRTAPLADGGAVDLAGAGVVPAPSNSDEPEQDNSASNPDEPGQDNSDDESCFSL